MTETRLIIVGGFLGAGKTTLLWEAARQISKNQKRVGLITNDQAPELVDTQYLLQQGSRVAEVSGSCFCCNFDGLMTAVTQLRKDAQADVLIAEPVGSCTDLSATIVQPLKEKLDAGVVISPMSVLVDVIRLNQILKKQTDELHPSAAYIFQKQMEEADILLLSKTDLISSVEYQALKARVAALYPGKTIIGLSVETGQGVDQWLEAVMTRTDAGTHIAQVDYDVYAEGEAVLGWLNTTIELKGKACDWKAFVENLLDDLSRQFDKLAAPVGHVKLVIMDDDRYVMGNLTGKRESQRFQGDAFSSPHARLTLNARVQMPPDRLEKIIRQTLDRAAKDTIQWTSRAWQCFSPARPEPTHRYTNIV